MSKERQEPRYVGTNWDKVRVEEKNGARGTTARKVVTRGEWHIDAAEIIAEVIAKLRQGYDVRLTDGKGEDAIRLYPCVAKGKSHMETTARPMGTLKTTLNDKTVELQNPRGEDEDEGGEEGEGEGVGEGVTPDVMMTCEVCGHRQRVGRRQR